MLESRLPVSRIGALARRQQRNHSCSARSASARLRHEGASLAASKAAYCCEREVTESAVKSTRTISSMRSYIHMSFWLMLCLLAGCGGQGPADNAQKVSIASLPPTDPDDPFDGPANATTSSKTLADYDSLLALIEDTLGRPIGKDETTQPPFSPPLNDDQIRDALRQSIAHVLTSPELADSRDFYGTHGDSEVILVNDGPINWPDNLNPEITGFRLRFASQFEPDGHCSNRRLGIRLEKLDLLAPSDGFMDGNIELSLINAGGTRNGAVIGGCIFCYVVQKRDDAVVANAACWFDP